MTKVEHKEQDVVGEDGIGSETPSEVDRKKQHKKPFSAPRVTKHGSLPKVTGQSFVGTFSP